MTTIHPIQKLKSSDFYKRFKAAIFASFITVISMLSIYVFTIYIDATKINHIEYGEYSVSVNERYELTILDRTFGKPIVFDSLLTRAVFYQLSNRYYSETNEQIIKPNNN